MSDLMARIGPKRYPNLSWVRPTDDSPLLQDNDLDVAHGASVDIKTSKSGSPNSHVPTDTMVACSLERRLQSPTRSSSLLSRMNIPLAGSNSVKGTNGAEDLSKSLLNRIDSNGNNHQIHRRAAGTHIEGGSVEADMDMEGDNNGKERSVLRTSVASLARGESPRSVVHSFSSEPHQSQADKQDWIDTSNAHSQLSSIAVSNGVSDGDKPYEIYITNGHERPTTPQKNYQQPPNISPQSQSSETIVDSILRPYTKTSIPMNHFRHSLTNDETEEGEVSPTLTDPDDFRNLMLPLVLKNAERRLGSGMDGAAHVQENVKDVLTDEVMKELKAGMELVRNQMAKGKVPSINTNINDWESPGLTAGSSTTSSHKRRWDVPPPTAIPLPQTSGPPGEAVEKKQTTTPTAPRAMLSGSAFNRKGKDRADSVEEQYRGTKRRYSPGGLAAFRATSPFRPGIMRSDALVLADPSLREEDEFRRGRRNRVLSIDRERPRVETRAYRDVDESGHGRASSVRSTDRERPRMASSPETRPFRDGDERRYERQDSIRSTDLERSGVALPSPKAPPRPRYRTHSPPPPTATRRSISPSGNKPYQARRLRSPYSRVSHSPEPPLRAYSNYKLPRRAVSPKYSRRTPPHPESYPQRRTQSPPLSPRPGWKGPYRAASPRAVTLSTPRARLVHSPTPPPRSVHSPPPRSIHSPPPRSVHSPPPAKRRRTSYSPHRVRSPPTSASASKRISRLPGRSRSPDRPPRTGPTEILTSRSRTQSQSHPQPRIPTSRHPEREGRERRIDDMRHVSVSSTTSHSLSNVSAFNELAQEQPKPSMHDASTSTPLDIGLLPKPCHSVPGLWFVKTGLSELGFLECEFEIDQETATKWDFFELANGCPTEKKPSPRKPQLSLQLLCLPIAEVQSVYARLTGASADDVATVMSKIKTGWPMSGHLLIEVNPKKSFAKAWLPYELDPETPPELKGYVQEGTNVVRFTQLSGMSDCVFVLYASATKTPEPAFTNLDGYLATMKSAPSSAFPGIRPATVSVMDS